MAPNYHNPNSPYGSGDPYYNESTGYISPAPMKKRTSNWLKIGVPVAVAVIIAVVVGAVVGSRHHSDNKTANTSGAASSGGDSSPSEQSAAASSAAAVKNAIGVFPTGTDSLYLLPLYPSTTNTAAFTTPTFHPTNDATLSWPQDPFQPSNPQPTNVRPDRPRLLAPQYKWQVLPQLIAHDPYLKGWNDTIFGNATTYYNLPPVQYFMDGSSGILDNCRYVKERVKAFAYVYRMTNDTKWVDRTWAELQNAAGPNFGPNNDTKWNPSHFLDTAEMTAAHAIAYDWLYDQWTPDQRSTIMQNMITYGLSQGIHEYQNAGSGDFSGWWAHNIQGNWNCVCNAGMTMGALAILGDDNSGTAQQILGFSVDNALNNCVNAVTSDGTWTETANYWYFGSTGYAEIASSLMTATGSDFKILHSNPSLPLTGLYHMHVSGFGSLFSYGDHGPNKYSSTANAMFLFGDQLSHPEYVLFQRDQHDAAEPNSMFWYNPTVSGAFWDGLELDHFFDDPLDQWAAMRSGWTDENGLYVAIKAGSLQNHQTHNDLDLGDFVLDALGTRWAGDLGSADYNAPLYFSNDTQDSARWLYYRKRTEGQNTILVNAQNQNVEAAPTVTHGTTGDAQGSSTVYDVPSTSAAYWIANLTSGYFDTQSFFRGIRTLNARKQVLLQDEITTTQPLMWRMHTNATVNIDQSNPTSATLVIGDQSLQMQILNPPSGAKFETVDAVRLDTDPPLPAGGLDSPNPGVKVVVINLPAGTYNIQVLFNPQWQGMSSSDFVTPLSVDLSNWTVTSHNSS